MAGRFMAGDGGARHSRCKRRGSRLQHGPQRSHLPYVAPVSMLRGLKGRRLAVASGSVTHPRTAARKPATSSCSSSRAGCSSGRWVPLLSSRRRLPGLSMRSKAGGRTGIRPGSRACSVFLRVGQGRLSMPNSPGMPSRPQAAGATTGSTQEQSKEIILPGSQVHAGQRELTPDDLDAAVTGARRNVPLARRGRRGRMLRHRRRLPSDPGLPRRQADPGAAHRRAAGFAGAGPRSHGGTRCNVPSPLRESSANPSPSPCA